MLVAGGNSTVIRLWSLRSERCVAAWPTHAESCVTTLVSPGGTSDGDVDHAAAIARQKKASDMCCFYMPAQWMMARLQWAAGEKMCHLPSGRPARGLGAPRRGGLAARARRRVRRARARGRPTVTHRC